GFCPRSGDFDSLFIPETANPSQGGGAKPRARLTAGSPGSRRDGRRDARVRSADLALGEEECGRQSCPRPDALSGGRPGLPIRVARPDSPADDSYSPFALARWLFVAL